MIEVEDCGDGWDVGEREMVISSTSSSDFVLSVPLDMRNVIDDHQSSSVIDSLGINYAFKMVLTPSGTGLVVLLLVERE